MFHMLFHHVSGRTERSKSIVIGVIIKNANIYQFVKHIVIRYVGKKWRNNQALGYTPFAKMINSLFDDTNFTFWIDHLHKQVEFTCISRRNDILLRSQNLAEDK